MNGTYLCTKCGLIASASEVFVYQSKDKNWRLRYAVDCINESCDGRMFECDEEMIVPIKMLNDKGYDTKFCCSGHLSDRICRGYVLFADSVNLESKPRGWYVDKKDAKLFGGTTIRYSFKEDAIDKKRQMIHRKMNALIRWADGLENRKEESK